jgi:hypothetical protein
MKVLSEKRMELSQTVPSLIGSITMAVRTVFIITLRKTSEDITGRAIANITSIIIAIVLTCGANIRAPRAIPKTGG